jgi:hypothetical protein
MTDGQGGYFVSLGVSICLDVVSIESLDLAVLKRTSQHVEKILTVQNPRLDSLDYPKISINLDFCQGFDRDLNLDNF